MEIEQLEIYDFLCQCQPLDKLITQEGQDKEAPTSQIHQIVEAMEIRYVRRGDEVLHIGQKNPWLYLIRSGAIEVSDSSGEITGRFTEGDWVGYRSILRGGTVSLSATALEDCLLYQLPASLFIDLVEHYPPIRDWFAKHKPVRLRSALKDLHHSESNTLIIRHVRELLNQPLVQVTEQASIQDTACKMMDAQVSAVLVTHQDKLSGIVTDRDFCTRAIAAGIDTQRPIMEIMTPDPQPIDADARGAEALLQMTRMQIQHLPVLAQGKPIGILNAGDLIRDQSHNTVLYLTQEVQRASTIETLKTLSQQLPETLCQLVESSLPAADIAYTISNIGEAISRRLLLLVESELGAPPVPYAWIAAGSLARREQTAHSDQDNGLILSDDYDAALHGAYFKQLSEKVCDGLDACGYIYCPGEVMAMTEKWRQPLAVWRSYFQQWIQHPEPKALMYSSIFFDLRCLHGESYLLEKLQKEILEQTRDNSIFLAYMAANAVQHRPPLGFFRNFVLDKHDTQDKALDMKKKGVTPVIDLARVYALSVGSTALSTQERLIAAHEATQLSDSGKDDLLDAFEFIATVRLRYQAAQIRRGEKPDHFVPPEHLSSLEKRHLKDAFEIVRTLQSALEQRYQTGRFA